MKQDWTWLRLFVH